ncbi:MAG: hypothetical protein JXA25_04725 [Anaerolineales bacterium]|nr:hypothetical protein [Anaerolineales bacterium]
MSDNPKTSKRKTWLWGGGVAVSGLLWRILLWFTYEPVSYGDTPSYLRLARSLADWSLSGYDGTRVPGYPVFLVLHGMDLQKVWITQLILGWALSLLLYWLLWKTTGCAWAGALLGGVYNLIPGQYLFESNMISETLSAFLVIATFTAAVAWHRSRKRRQQLVLVFLAGLLGSLAGLVRPAFFLLSVWFLIFFFFAEPGGLKARIITSLIYGIPPLLLLGGWLGWMYSTYHVISPDAMGGYHMIQHTGVFFEKVPAEHAALRDTYLKYRDAQIAERGSQTNAIWDAIPEMREVSGLSFYDLSRELNSISQDLIREYPGLYLRNVVTGWINFWKAPVYWDAALFSSPLLRKIFGFLAPVGRGLSIAANFLFLFLSAVLMLSSRLRKRADLDLPLLASGGLVWLISIVQTLADHGDNPRFLMPLQMLVFFVVLRTGYTLFISNPVQEEESA